MSVDPMHPKVKKLNVPRNRKFIKEAGVPVILDGFCRICQVYVDSKTKHCKPCNKCISEFDHHCQFLSTCIGSKNYLSFCICVFSGLLVTTLLSILSTYLLYLAVFNNIIFNFAVNNSILKNVNSTIFIMILIIIYGVLNIVGILFFINLIQFHIKLWYYNLSTYDYLDRKEAKKYDPHGFKTDPTVPQKNKDIIKSNRRPRLYRCGFGHEGDEDFDHPSAVKDIEYGLPIVEISEK
ncbi:hypothetical protein HDU92_005186 [Lobulomyces angularis]|nr:hypothetical protein HDU92_005186 [Lobulomyces angularis]